MTTIVMVHLIYLVLQSNIGFAKQFHSGLFEKNYEIILIDFLYFTTLKINHFKIFYLIHISYGLVELINVFVDLLNI